MSLTFVVIGDCHFKTDNKDETDLMTSEIDSIIDEVQPQCVVVLGDTLDRHDTVKTAVQERAVDWLASIAKRTMLVLLIGNHDLKSNDQFFSTQHPFTALKHWSNTVVVDSAVRIEDVVFVPYVPPGRFHEALSYVEDYTTAKLIFAHQEFKGASIDSFMSVDGDEWSLQEPLVISGHIHQQQYLKYPTNDGRLINKILYTGTPIQQSFAECEDKYVYVVTLTESTYESSETVEARLLIDSSIDIQERLLTTTIKKRVIVLTSDQLHDYVFEKNDRVKIKVKIRCRRDEVVILNKDPIINKMRKLGYKITYEPSSDPTVAVPVARVIIRTFDEIVSSKLSKERQELTDIYTRVIS